jgi:CSLREA domain-containing protein
VLALALAGLPFGVTTASAAGPYSVNSTADTGDASPDGTCDSGGGVCTLREAIEEANNEATSPGTDAITFASTPFNGEDTDAIDIGATALPAITAPATISCQTDPVSGAPCVQVGSPPAASNVFTVNADSVSISDVAVTSALQGISVFEDEVAGSLTGFQLKHSWIGITLAGTAGAHNNGVFLDPSVVEARIGGTTAADRNVIANNNVAGLLITGADGSAIEGNYFGVLADGTTQAAQPFNIKIGGADLNPTDDPAIGNQIGGLLTVPQRTSPECDGACNVIAGATADGIDLAANAALGQIAAGESNINGNYIGLNAPGTGVVANATNGIDVGAAESVSIGNGSEGANYISGGTTAVAISGSTQFDVGDNRIGVSFDQNAVLGAPATGVDATITGSGLPFVSRNRIVTSTGDGIRISGGTGVEVNDNLIGVGAGGQGLGVGGAGIRFISSGAPEIEANLVAGADGDGLVLDNSGGAALIANTFGMLGVGLANTGAGLRMTNGSSENVVGDDLDSDKFNDFSNNLGAAIAIEGATSDENQVLGNTAAGNALFIDLGDDGLGATTGANDDIQAPEVTTVAATSASGTAEPAATVRVYEKSGAANGTVDGLIGTTVADGSGNWEVAYGSAPAFVGATQTVLGDGTSELAVEPLDETAPETTITKKPKKKSTKRKARFKFESSEGGSTFECKLDRKPFKPCESPFKKKVKPKKHKFLVRAIDPAGNVDRTPAKAKFKVLEE